MRPSSEVDLVCWIQGWITKSLNPLCDPMVGWQAQFHCFYFSFVNYCNQYFVSNFFSIQRPFDPLYHIYFIYFILEFFLLSSFNCAWSIMYHSSFNFFHSWNTIFFSRISVQCTKSIVHYDIFDCWENDGFCYLFPSLIFVDYSMDFQCWECFCCILHVEFVAKNSYSLDFYWSILILNGNILKVMPYCSLYMTFNYFKSFFLIEEMKWKIWDITFVKYLKMWLLFFNQ